MSATQDFVALEWIRGELANTLQRAQLALEAAAESPDDLASMRSCLTAIHQVHGTLKMVQLEGPTQVADEMEQIAQSLMNNSVPELAAAQETLMQAILQLPAYLDRLHRDQKDSEQNYLPMVNNLRAARGAERLPGAEPSDSIASGPDLSALLTPPTEAVTNAYFQADGEGNLPKIRARYQQAFGNILKKNNVRENLTTMGKLFSMLGRLCGESPMGNLAQIGLGVIEGMANGAIKLDNTSAGLLRAVDGLLQQLSEAGQDGLSTPVPEDIAAGMVGLINGASKETDRISSLKARYAGEAAEPEEIAIGPDEETMSAVAKILIEELTSVTDKLDLYVRSSSRNSADLLELLPNLEQISSTMVVLGDMTQQQVIASQIEVIKNIEHNGDPAEETLLEMAQSLLQIEASLSALILDGEDGDGDSFGSLDEAQAAVVRETRTGLASGKDRVIDFISSDFDHSKLESVADDLFALRGGLFIVNQSRAGDVLEAAANYVRHGLMAGSVRPELEQMDDLADALTSVDYFLERLLENASDPYLQMLEVAEAAVTKLGYPVGVEVAPAADLHEEPVIEPVEVTEETVVASAAVVSEIVEQSDADEIAEALVEVEEPSAEVEEPSAEVEEPSAEVEEPSAEIEEPSAEVEEPLAEVEEPSAELEEPSAELEEPESESEEDDLIDDEILEIFVEEAEEVLETIEEFLPQFRNDTGNGEALTELRRAFHTLKGSGRMVGATVVGELAWSIENLLNRVIDNTVEPGPAVLDIIGTVVTRIPEGVEAFKDGHQHRFVPDDMAAIADALSEGRDPSALIASASPIAAELIVEEEPSAEVIEEPSAEVIEEPSAELIEEPPAELIEEPSADLVEEPSADLVEEPSADLVEEPSAEVVEEPSAEVLEEPSAEVEALSLESVEQLLEDEALALDQIDLEESEEEPVIEELEIEELETLEVETEETADDDLTVALDRLEDFEIDDLGVIGEEPSADFVEEPSAEVIEEPSADLVEEPSAEEVTGQTFAAPVDETAIAVEEVSIEGLVDEEDVVDEIEFEEPETFDPESVEETTSGFELEGLELDTTEASLDDFLEEEPSAEVIEEPSADFEEEPSAEVEALSLESVEQLLEDEALALDQIDLEESDEEPVIEELETLEVETEETADGDLTVALDRLEDFEIDDLGVIGEEPSADVIEEPSADFVEEPSADFVEEPSAEVIEEPSADFVEEPSAEVEDTYSASAAELLIDSDDLELEEIFALEAEEKLQDIDRFVATGGPVTGELVAAFHTLKGSSAMAEINAIATVTAPLEHLANDYLIQNRAADDRLLSLVSESAALVRVVLSDIDGNRDQVEGADALLAKLQGNAVQAEPEVTFDFQKIILLSESNIASDGWQDIEALVDELQHTIEQAEALNQPILAGLATSMLRFYSGPGRPDDLALSLMKRAHDRLVFMFDALASSQPLREASQIVSELDALDLAALVEPSAGFEEEPSAEVIEEPSADVIEEPSADLIEEPSAEIVEEPSAAPVETDLPEDDVDEDILPIFLEETDELQEEIDESILGWTEEGAPGDHLDNLLRQLHTLKGGARMAGLSSLGEFAHNFETFLIGIQSKPVEYDEKFFALLNAQQDEITRRVEIFQKVATDSATEEELQSMRTAAIPSLDSPIAGVQVSTVEVEPSASSAEAVVSFEKVVELPEDAVDEDILPIFLEESDDLVEELESSIQTWSESPGNKEIHDLLLRNLHTLKGGARMAGLNSLGEYAHNFETFLIGIQQNPVELDDDFFALLNQRQDEVIRRVEIYKRLSVGAATDEDLASMKQALEPSLEAEPVSVESEPVGETAEVAQTAPADKGAASANQEMVRVSADLLADLISLAGESSITRGRVEQQISDFGESLQEMEETIYRIRDQVRRLEIEAESRETLIQTKQADKESSFDELEMDRYTMLQAISRVLSEATSDMMDLKETLANRSRDAETILHQQARISAELQEGLTRTSMVPFARLIPRLRRIVRQVSGEVGKSVRFDAYNVEGELDRNVLERIVAPLEHMLRNAVDHGIESTEDRLAAGKQEQGRISLRLSREGGYVVLTVSDDGGGIHVDAVRTKAIERGLMTEGQGLSDHDVMQFILHAGFSTAQKLTQISGRGVGMDVVVSEIKSLGGSISIDSKVGFGSEFTIRIPFTVSINRALMVVVREETYAVPLNTIEGIVRVSPYELEAYYQPDAPMFEYAGQPYKLAYMGKLLDSHSEDPSLMGQVSPLPVILARSGDESVALQVDRVIGSREVVVKTLGSQFDDVGGISGATVLGDGSVVIILDCMALVRSAESAAALAVIEQEPAQVEQEREKDVRTVMIVDDSVTVRKVTTRLMERHGFEVTTAKDGIDAMNQLQDIRPDVVLLDIEMPRMDGFEVLRSVRRDEELKDLPIIMITSRTGEKHKQQAMELGVNEYLGKPFQEASLLSTIEDVLSKAKAGSKQD